MFEDVKKITMGFEIATNVGPFETVKVHGGVEVAVVNGDLKLAREQAMGSLNRQLRELESIEFIDNAKGVQQIIRSELATPKAKK